MARLTNRYAEGFLEYAKRSGKLEELYHQALPLSGEEGLREETPPSEEMIAFLKTVLERDVEPVMKRFVDLAREELSILDVEVISAVELNDHQLAKLEERLIRLSGKRVDIKTIVDPKIIGGLRIIAGGTVIDNSIKTQLNEMKSAIYKGVYFNQ